MSMIHCDQCARQIADTAAACPGCGNPIASRSVVIERTGKRLKLQYALAVIAMLTALPVSMIGCAAESAVTAGLGGLAFVAAMTWYFSVRVSIWWYHH